jgi:hypothetical protein
MNTEEKLEQFRQFLAGTVSHREDLMVNAPDYATCEIYGGLHDLAREIEHEFIRTFFTELTVGRDEQT